MKKLLLVLAVCISLILLVGCMNKDSNQSTSGILPSTNSGYTVSIGEKSQNSATTSNKNSTTSSINTSISTSNYSENSNITSTSTSSGSQTQNPNAETLSYSQRMNIYLENGYINDQTFKNYITNLGDYNKNCTLSTNSIFASPTGNGNGTINSPYGLQDALDNVVAGQTIYLRAGTYDPKDKDGYYVETKGSANAYITIRPYPNENVIITNTASGSELYAFQYGQDCCYTIMEGLEISNISSHYSRGIAVWGNNQNHLIFRNNSIHDIKTTATNPETDSNCGSNAILLIGENVKPISNVLIMQNNCYKNVTGWAETLSVAGNCEYIYVIENTVENNTNIGIDFYGNAKYCSNASLDQPRFCIAAKNTIKKSSCSYADCAGLYVDGARDIMLAYNYVSESQYGIEIGSEEKNETYLVKNIMVKNNILNKNNVAGIRIGGYETNATGYVTSTKIYNNTLIENDKSTNNQAEIVLAKVDGIDIRNNIIYKSSLNTIISSDFNSSYTKNLTFKNNYYYVASQTASNIEFGLFASTQMGLNSFNALTSGTDKFEAFNLDSNFCPTSNSPTINSADNTVQIGNYDFYLKQRINGSLDCGAVEFNN